MYENKQNMLSYTNIIISTTQNLELNKQLPNGSRSEQNIVKHTTWTQGEKFLFHFFFFSHNGI